MKTRLLGCLLVLNGCIAVYEPAPVVTDAGMGGHTGTAGGIGGGVGGGAAGGGGFAGGGGGGAPGCFPSAQLESGAVLEPLKAPPPISGGTLAIAADGTVLAADSDRDNIYFFTQTRLLTTLALQPNDEPGRIVLGPTNRAFVALRRAGLVAELDLSARKVVARHAVCKSPRGLGWSAAKNALYVACASGDLTRLAFTGSGSTLSLADTTTTQPAGDLRDVIVVPDGVLVSTFRDARMIKVADDGSVSAQPSPAPVMLDGLGPDGGFRITTQADAGIAFAPHVAWRTVATPNGALMVHQREQLTAVGDGSCDGVSYGSGKSSRPGTIHTVVERLTATGVELVTTSRVVLPVDVAMSDDGARLAIASPASGVSLLATFNGFRVDFPNVQATAVAFRGDTLIAFSREPATLYFIDPQSLVSKVVLDTTSVASTGHELFHRATANAVACASCHPEAGDDGHVWNLPEGARRTPTLRGGLISTAPFHWAGDQADIGSLMADVWVKRMNGLPQSPPRSAAMLKWLDAQPALPPPGALDPLAVGRGGALFMSEAVGCAACHSGTLGTNNANSNVGTGGSFQVPRLVELAHRAPFFHDGRVASLEARFGPAGGGELHGHTAQLTPAELSDLVVYLQSR